MRVAIRGFRNVLVGPHLEQPVDIVAPLSLEQGEFLFRFGHAAFGDFRDHVQEAGFVVAATVQARAPSTRDGRCR
jgi:hypothetical protein